MKTKQFLLMIALLAIGTASAQKTTHNGIVYMLSSHSHTAAVIESTNNLPEDVTIPASITADNAVYSVTAIAPRAFEKNSKVKSIQLPACLTEIREAAFRQCENLTSITFPDEVTNIGKETLQGCPKLTSIKLPAKLKTIGEKAFAECTALTQLTIPDEVTNIGKETLQGCPKLTSIKLPAKLKTIGEKAFAECTALTQLTIPDEVTGIGMEAFARCISLRSIQLSGKLTAIEYATFKECTELAQINIPETVTSIGQQAFYQCSSLQSIVLPGKLETIEYATFQGCSELTGVTIPDEVTKIEPQAFSGCTKLQSVKLPAKLQTISYGAFYWCPALTQINIPATVTRLTDFIFGGCTSLTSITVDKNNTAYTDCEGVLFNKDKTRLITYPAAKETTRYAIPRGVVDIEFGAFFYCYKLMSVEIPESVTSILGSTFMYCGGLTDISVSTSNPAYKSIAGVLFTKDQKKLMAYPIGKDETYYQIPDGTVNIVSDAFNYARFSEVYIPPTVTAINDRAFQQCKNLTSVWLPDGLTTIGINAFHLCTSLNSINIPEGITTIKRYTFNGTALNSIHIPAKVKTIELYAFNDRLTSIYCDSKTPPEINQETFINYTPVLYVPKGCLAAYRSAQYWQNFTRIEEEGSDITAVQAENGIIYSDGHLTLPYAQTAEVAIYSSTGTPAGNYLLSAGESCDLNFLPAGIYIIKVKAGEKTMSTKIIR